MSAGLTSPSHSPQPPSLPRAMATALQAKLYKAARAVHAVRAVRHAVRHQPGSHTNYGTTKRCSKVGSGHWL